MVGLGKQLSGRVLAKYVQSSALNLQLWQRKNIFTFEISIKKQTFDYPCRWRKTGVTLVNAINLLAGVCQLLGNPRKELIWLLVSRCSWWEEGALFPSRHPGSRVQERKRGRRKEGRESRNAHTSRPPPPPLVPSGTSSRRLPLLNSLS